MNRLEAISPMDAAGDYESEFIEWTETQAALLRSLPEGFHGLDTINLAEEIADLGRSEIRAASSLLRQLLVHLIKLTVDGGSDAADHWVEEALVFQADAADVSTPAIRRRIDIDKIWIQAVNIASQSLNRFGHTLSSTDYPNGCPFTIEELLAESFNPTDFTTKLSSVIHHGDSSIRHR